MHIASARSVGKTLGRCRSRRATIRGVPTRVLIVDDHALFRRSARRLLELEGYEVVGEAGDGAAALAAVDELRPDVVLLDVNLPDATGFDIAGRLRGRGVRVVLTSDRDPSEVAPF